MHQANALALLRRQPIELEARFRQIEHSAGHVHADDLRELVIGQEAAQELAFAAPQIEHTRSAGSLQHLEHGVEAAFVQADRPLDRRLLFVLPSGRGFFLGLFLRRQPGDGVANEPSLMHEIARDDGVARRMAVEPALPVTKQLFDFVVPNPVVLLIVENRNQHVQVRQQVAQPARCSQRNREQSARAERRHALVEFVTGRFDRIAERLEQRAEERLAAAAGHSRETCFERQLGRRELGFLLASAAQGGVEPARKHDREQRRGDVRPVVDVLVLSAALAAAATDHSDRVDVEQHGRRAGRLGRLRVEHCRVAERELPRVHMLRMLVQQESEVGRRLMRRSDGQEHELVGSQDRHPVYRDVTSSPP